MKESKVHGAEGVEQRAWGWAHRALEVGSRPALVRLDGLMLLTS
jgi:hypothetical protein